MWIKTKNGSWVDTSKIEAVAVHPTYVGVVVSGSFVTIANGFNNKDAKAYATDFVSKYLKEDNHVD